MNNARRDLGIASYLKAEAIGEPGQRTFRLVVEAENGSAFIWVEKEQLSALGLAIKRFGEELGGAIGSSPAPASLEAPREPSVDFKVASLGLAYDEGRELFAVLAYDTEDFESKRATVAFWTTRARADSLADEALEVVAAGRPICFLCKQPMDPEGHACAAVQRPPPGGRRALDSQPRWSGSRLTTLPPPAPCVCPGDVPSACHARTRGGPTASSPPLLGEISGSYGEVGGGLRRPMPMLELAP